MLENVNSHHHIVFTRLLVQFVDNVKVADNVKDDVKDKAKEQD